MKTLLKLAVAAGYFILGQDAYAQADPAFCQQILVPDTTMQQNDMATQLSYLSVINKENFQQHQANASGNFEYAKGLIDASGSYEDFDEKRSREYQKYGYSFRSSDLSKFYQSRLPPERAEIAARVCGGTPYGFRAKVTRADPHYVEVKVSWSHSQGARKIHRSLTFLPMEANWLVRCRMPFPHQANTHFNFSG